MSTEMKMQLREIARIAGAVTYDPVRPCKHGHRALRYVSSDACLACIGRRLASMYNGPKSVYSVKIRIPPLAPADYDVLDAELQRVADLFVAALTPGLGTQPAIAPSMPAEPPPLV